MNKQINNEYMKLIKKMLLDKDKIIIKVKGSSMIPTIQPNSLVEVCKSDNYKVNDIVIVEREHHYIVHRIIKIENIGKNKYILTKGDNNRSIDRWYKVDKIMGRVTTIN